MTALMRANIPVHAEVWAAAVPFLQMALDKTDNKEWEIPDVLNYVNSGKGQLLLGRGEGGEILTAAVVGESIYYQTKVVEVFLMGAKKGTDWMPLLEQVIDHSRALGYTHLRLAGRRWVKVLKKFGEARETYTAELTL